MKIKTLTILIILCSNFLSGQITYFNYLDYTTKRIEVSTGWTGFSNYSITQTFYIGGDTLINGNWYYKEKNITVNTLPWSVASGPRFIREDNNFKFYVFSPQTNSETVLYDWGQYLTLSVGSTFPNSGCTVLAIDSILLGIRYLKRWHGALSSGTSTSVSTPNPGFVVEGIGLIFGTGICVNAIHSGFIMNCYLKQSNSLSFNAAANCSGLNSVGLSENKLFNGEEFLIFPNPVNDILNIELISELNIDRFIKIQILSSIGQLIREEDITFKNENVTIKTNELSNGVYLLNLKNDNSLNVSKRFVISR